MPRTAHACAIGEPPAILLSRNGVPVPLKEVTATGRLKGPLFELTVEQRYENDSRRNLEAVFTFPLPLRAVLLGFDLEIGGRKFKAYAVARREASEEYESAIDSGNTAALIEHNGQGLYTVSLGNLEQGETALIRYRYAELLDAYDGYLRLNVPTVIAPRYGNPRDSGLDGPTIPGVDLLSEYPFAIQIDLIGITNTHSIRSPSHIIRAETEEGRLSVALSGTNFLDRDFVLELDRASIPTHALVASDHNSNGYVVMASATLGLEETEQRPLVLKILLDCSGSMGGDSIAAAKRALIGILERLTPDDGVSLTRFGSTFQHVTEGLVIADRHSLTPLKAVVRRMDADLGGTEMEKALKATLRQYVSRGQQADVILITDGEIYDVAGMVDLAARSGHRLFAIAIGASPVEALARSLADNTGGACEFVGPNEDAEAAILRTFKRLRSNPRTLGPVQWPCTPDWTAPLPTAVFPGDTLHLLAGFTTVPTGDITLTISDATSQGTTIQVPTASYPSTSYSSADDLLPRLAAARRLAALPDDAARRMAMLYQLATQYTSFVVVAERADDEKATDLPETVVVPHPLVAGWGGVGVVANSSQIRTMDGEYHGAATPRFARNAASFDMQPGQRPFLTTTFELADRDSLIHSLHDAFQRRQETAQTLDELAELHPLPDAVLSMLRVACNECEADQEKVIAAFLAWLGANTATNMLSPDFLAMLRGRVSGVRGFRSLRKFMSEGFAPRGTSRTGRPKPHCR